MDQIKWQTDDTEAIMITEGKANGFCVKPAAVPAEQS